MGENGHNQEEAERIKLLKEIIEFKRNEQPNYYEILGCSPLNSTEQIQTEYKRRALKIHPDKLKTEDAKDSFALLNEAYEVLKDEGSRFVCCSG